MPPRTPLLRPDRYFAEREPDTRRVLLVLALAGAATLAGVVGVGAVLAEKLDGTVMVDNPDHVSSEFCEDSPLDSTPEGCGEPPEIERNADALLWDAFGDLLVPLTFSLLIVFLVTAVMLYVGASLSGGDGGWLPAFQAVAWGAVPSLFSLALGLGLLYAVVDPVTVGASSDLSVSLEAVKEQIRSAGSITTVLGLGTLGWTVVIWRFCLEHGYELDKQGAWTAAGVVGALYALGILL